MGMTVLLNLSPNLQIKMPKRKSRYEMGLLNALSLSLQAEPVGVLAPQRARPGALGQELLPRARRQEGQRRHHVERRLLRPESRQQESTLG